MFLGSTCINPIGQSGYCVNIRQCAPLLELLKVHGNAVGDFLRSSVCGFDGADPQVCCPSTFNGNTNTERTIFPNPEPEHTPAPEPPIPQSQFGPLYSPQCGIANTTYTRVVGGVPAKLGKLIII